MHAIQTIQLTKSYPAKLALDNLELNIPWGGIYSLLGPNGSGKSTTLKILSTLLAPSDGTAFVAGHDIKTSPVQVRQLIGYVFQESALDPEMTVWGNLLFAGALYGYSKREVAKRAQELIDLFELQNEKNTFVKELSFGMRRSIDIARGLLHKPKVLFLDEPTLGLDVIQRQRMWEFIYRLNKSEEITILLTTHYLDEVSSCDVALFMNKGKLIGEGSPADLIQDLGDSILEIVCPDIDTVSQQMSAKLGPCLIEGNKGMFRLNSREFAFEEIKPMLSADIDSMQIRNSNLNDIFIWMNKHAAE